ncbi:lipoprotein-releasing system ATP-binding protein [Desulfatibacillum alkenivorans DSM 16219]|jgi:lipoprotein-releasing system ATP-binding protein|uniref:Lipoprotein-releasing system ATP-binding protein n=1 Tax=Desulfatibacillum alkenivorans DSM 16219 TaxID=1121393 RepID=A0A1M6CM76_9BACT|nr:ABC transporter ATP-binding protein [Desulfatibacillum alkenivorans]SHI62023.1 lipoprotein-releasing system ATP-binding protein [Desulfatibacillum alkenivorans DSM 16219]
MVEVPCIEAKGLVRRFATDDNTLTILSGLDFTAPAGQSVAVVGASGIGKSTLLHILGALDRPDAGELHINGRDVFAMQDAQLSRFRNKNVGFVFQFHHLLPGFTALENAAMPARISGLNAKQAEEKAEAMLERVGMSHRLNHRIGELSGGEQQRVAVARALIMDPPLLLADEPTGNLDVKTGALIHELLCELNQEKKMTMVVVTHNMQLAEMMQRQVTVSEGKLILEQ